MPLIETERGNIYFTDHRKSEKPPVILIHGAGGSHLDWAAGLRRLPEANAIALDLPGHGKSPAPGRTSIYDYAVDVIALLDALEIPQAIIAGHSMGGAIAQVIGLQYTSRITGVILVGTAAKLVVNPYILETTLTSMEEVSQTLVKWMWGPKATDEMRTFSYQRMNEISPQILYGDYIACDGFDIRDQIHNISVPVLVIGGEVDKMTPPKFSQHLADTIPNAQLIIVPEGGHMMALEQPQIVIQAIKEWLNHAAT